jgi:DNA primase
MRLPDGFLDELRARTPLAAIIGRRVKLSRSGRNWKGCCPFHNEKSPSFYVYEDGYHCFGCGAHGDAVSFVMQSQGLQFREAVETLASEAGLEVPKASPEAAQVEQRRTDLQQVMEIVASLYQHRLGQPEGAKALAYLRGRGLSDETIASFGLGWSGEGRGQLAQVLAKHDVTPAQLLEVGLLRESEDGRAPYELFFNRVMFPIRDRQGRIVSFGGRTLGDGQPKYVNGPETPLFSKRRNLFALDRARLASRQGKAVVVVEGYMDAISLHQAGFTGAVAPLGTALTEEQLAELWKISPMPVLCFDGDRAGERAALRAAEVALPHLTAERSLKLARLPAGEDPDTLVRKQGAAAFQRVLDEARPISLILYDLLAAGVGGTPEQRAGLRARLEEAADKVEDRFLGDELRRELRNRYFEANKRPRPAAVRPPLARSGRGGRMPAFEPSVPITRTPPAPQSAHDEKGRTMIAILLNHPQLLHEVEEALGMLELPEGLARLRDAIMQWSSSAEKLDSAALMNHLNHSGLAQDAAQALSAAPAPLAQCAAASAMPAEAEAGWWHFFGLMNPRRLDEEVSAAQRSFAETGSSQDLQRLVALRKAQNRLNAGLVDWEDAQDDDD